MPDFSVPAQTVTPVALMWLIPLFPLLGATVNGLFGKRLQDQFGKRAVHTVALGAMALAAATSVFYFVKLLSLSAEARFLHSVAFPMISIGKLKVDMAFAMDPLSGMMALIITIIGSLIHIYSAGYMHEEPAYWRFFCYLNLFVFSMLLLVLGDNFIIMFFGWEGVGLCSYLLIGFWYTDVAKAKAGMKAFIVNRVGDFGFVTGMFFLFWGLGGAWQANDRYVRDLGVGNIMQAAVVEHEEAPSAAPEHVKEGKALANIPIGPTLTF